MTFYNTDLTVKSLAYVWGHTSGGAAGLKAVSDFASNAVVPSQMEGIQSITATVATNALTLGWTPNGPSSFRNPTLSNGAPVSVTVANPLSLVVPSGATLGTTNGVQSQLVIALVYNAGVPALAVNNIAGGLVLDETGLISTTAISAGSSSASVWYSASAISNSPYRIVGYVTSTQSTAGTWATAPSLVQGDGGEASTTPFALAKKADITSVDYKQVYANKTGNYTALTTDNNAFINVTATSVTISLTAAATLAANWHCIVYANGFDVIIDPNAAELINGAATLTVKSGCYALIYCTGTSFVAAIAGDILQPLFTIASATTTDLSTVNSTEGTITGTTTITALGTAAAGTLRNVYFGGALTLTHNATSLILPTGANITTVAGDRASFLSLGSGNWRCVYYLPKVNMAVGQGVPDVILEDQKASGSSGGSATAATWNTRTLNQKPRDPSSLVTLAANQFTPTVAMWAEWTCPASAVDGHQTRIFNVTDSVVTGYGSTAYSNSVNTGPDTSHSMGGCALVAGKTYRLDHYTTTAYSNGLGLGSSSGGTQIYSRVRLWRA